MAEKVSLKEYVREVVPDWDDEEVATARFKAFTGQREDWEGRLQFWKDLIVKVARHLDVIVLDTQAVKQNWFVRDGILPMGLNQVLAEMIKSGELEPVEKMLAPGSSSNLQLATTVLRKALVWAAGNFLGSNPDPEPTLEDRMVIMTLLQDRVTQLIQHLTDSHYSSSCVVTLARLQELCGGPEDAEIILSYLQGYQRAQHITVNSSEKIEGFKISLRDMVTTALETDQNLLQLHWTMEMLQLRLNTLDNRTKSTQNLLVKAVKTRQKENARRLVRMVKVLNSSRDQCVCFMEKIEGVLNLIGDAEMSKRVSEAVKVGNAAIKEHSISLEDVQSYLQELDESMSLQHQAVEMLAEAPLGSTTIDDDALDEELELLELELESTFEIKMESLPNLKHENTTEPVNVRPAEHTSKQKPQQELETQFSKMVIEAS